MSKGLSGIGEMYCDLIRILQPLRVQLWWMIALGARYDEGRHVEAVVVMVVSMSLQTARHLCLG